MKIALYFPRFVEEEDNLKVMEEELKAFRSNLQKGKSPGPDGWTVEFYLEFFDIIRKYLLVVVERPVEMGTCMIL